ncbi:MAG: lipid-A-disaccharide synthase [Bacteriovoracaceae bacterium]
MIQNADNVLIIAGEKSGEEHCLSFFEELKNNLPQTEFWGVGGDELIQKGFKAFYHLRDFSSWGFSEVIGKIPFYYKALNRITQTAIEKKTKVAILIDFQTFNLKLAARLRKVGVKVYYMVAPQAWAWKSWRVKTLAENCEELFTIIPFEKKWFKDRGVKQTVSIDHPIWIRNQKFFKELDLRKDPIDLKTKKSINLLILPGSRNFEFQELMPYFNEVVRKLKKTYPQLRSRLVFADSLNQKKCESHLNEVDEIVGQEDLTESLQNADLCLAASGTVTLNCGIFQLPTVVCYRSSLLNQAIYECFVNYKGPISLNNIIHEQKLFPELIQDDVEVDTIIKILENWIDDSKAYTFLIHELEKTKKLIQGEVSSLGDYLSERVEKVYEVHS